MNKRLFEVLDDMNQEDTANGTSLVGVSGNLIEANLIKAGTKVTMGAPANVVHDLLSGKTIPILLLIDKAEYFKRTQIGAEKVQAETLV